MINSKQLKEDFDCGYDPNDLEFFHRILYFLEFKIFWIFIDLYNMYKDRVTRSYAYARFGWLNQDFDLSYVYQLLHFKLKRLHSCLKNGVSIQEDPDMEALKDAIKITYRLAKIDYDRKYLRIHDRRWGKIENRTEPIVEKDGKAKYYNWISWRRGTVDVSDEIKAQEKKEFLECYDKGEADRCEDIDHLALLLKKHGLSWWD